MQRTSYGRRMEKGPKLVSFRGLEERIAIVDEDGWNDVIKDECELSSVLLSCIRHAKHSCESCAE
jgi:hypothetical protein